MTEINTIIIGAGAAGLAVSASLKQAGISSVILEQNTTIGSTWRRHYDRLHLHTDKKNSELPFMPFPNDYPRYASRDQLVAYLESYVNKFNLDIRFAQKVVRAEKKNNLWEVTTSNTVLTAPNLVLATGYARQPQIPNWPGQNLFKGKIIHSAEYKNGTEFNGKNVLVVGFGNSGGEIAIDLHEHGAKPSLSVRSAVNVIPRELFGIPILSIGIVMNKLPANISDAVNAPILRAVMGDITKLGLRKLPYGPATQIRNDKRIPLLDVGTLKLIREGHIKVFSGVESFTETGIRFEGGKEAAFDAVVLATGYRPRVDEILKADATVVDANGTPFQSGGESTLSGLYFCGYYVSPTGMLREIGIEAEKISKLIANKK